MSILDYFIKEPITLTREQHLEQERLIAEELAKPAIRVPMLDSLLGTPVDGYEGVYWNVLKEDPTKCGLIRTPNGVTIPVTTHIPTGSRKSYRKVFKVINGAQTPVWEVHQKDLGNSHHEPYED